MDPSSTSDVDWQSGRTYLEAVADLSQTAQSEADLNRLLEDVSATVADTLGTEYAAVIDLDTDATGTLRAGVGWRDGVVGHESVSMGEDSPLGRALCAADPVTVADHGSPVDLLSRHDVRRGITVSIESDGTPWGILGTYSSEEWEAPRQAGVFLESVASILESAIQNEQRTATDQQYRTLIENFRNGVLTYVDQDLRYTVVGGEPIDPAPESGADMEGLPVQEAVSDEFAEVLVPRYRAALDGEPSSFEHERDGTHAKIDVYPLRDDSGEVIAAMGVSQDITDRKRAEADRRESEARFHTLMEQSPFSIQIFDADGETIAANPAWERLWDTSRDELTDYNILEDEQLEAAGLLDHIRGAFDGDVVELPELHYDPAGIGKPGRDRWVQGYAYPLVEEPDDNFEVAIVHHDVTDRNERERELERVRERMEFALEATDAVVWDWNVDEDEASFYPSAESLYGTPVEDWEDFIEVIHPDDRELVQEKIEASLESGEPKYEEIRIQRDDEVRWIEAPGQPVNEDDGSTRMIGVARDVTERKTYERRLKESNERLEQFAHAASHDLREPLRMVSSYLQLIEQRYRDELDEDGEEFIEFAVDGADRMREMIDSLLAYSRIETRGEPFEPVDLNEVVDAVLTDLEVSIDASDADVSVASLPQADGDANQLRELLQNLVANAIEYRGDEPPVVEISAEADGDDWVIAVRDEGIGIDPANQDTAFEVFERLHSREEHEGTGIGLALCERIVERHGGRMWVDSTPGEGSTFYFSLPRDRPHERA